MNRLRPSGYPDNNEIPIQYKKALNQFTATGFIVKGYNPKGVEQSLAPGETRGY